MTGGKLNREDPGTKLLELYVDLAKRGFSILTFDRRGCGQSATASLKGRSRLDNDFAGAVKYIRNRKGYEENIFLLGMSVGAVAAFAFTKKDDSVRAIISDSCFVSISEMARRVMGQKCKAFIVFEPGAICMGRLIFGLEKENAIDNVQKIKCPIFFINGAEDKSVPPEDAHRLLVASHNPSDKIWIVDGADHSQSFCTYPDEYVAKVVSFLSNNRAKLN
jgi:hypothetical protein